MQLPPSTHVVWKIAGLIVLFVLLLGTKYLGYEQFEAFKDIRAALIETIGIAILFLSRGLYPKGPDPNG